MGKEKQENNFRKIYFLIFLGEEKVSAKVY